MSYLPKELRSMADARHYLDEADAETARKAADEIERLQERFDLALRKNGEQWAEIERLQQIEKIYIALNAISTDQQAQIAKLQAVVDAAGEYLYDTSKRDVLLAAYLAVSEYNDE